MTSSGKLRTYKLERNKEKKQKLDALLELIRQDLSELSTEKRKSNTFGKALRHKLEKYQEEHNGENTMSPNTSFFSEDDERHSFVLQNYTEPLFIEDIRSLILRSLLGSLSPFPLYWAKFKNVWDIEKTVFLEIGGLPHSDIVKLQSKLIENQRVKPFIVEILSSNIPFASDLSTLHLLNNAYNPEIESYSSIFPIKMENSKKQEESNSKNASRLHLLLSPIQLAMEHYPLPPNVFEQSKSEGYCFSKESYTMVTENSPMFAIDCEMCKTVSGRYDVTRIAIVNENLKVVYHTLVKPEEDIINYLTKISGITEGMLQNVKTTLKDVQDDIQRLLPSHAILCGQSLNNDLHGLRMIHPFVIDTSVIYNESGVRQKKTSLRKLAHMHLKETIQDSDRGHSPIQDSIATMKLVQLKLNNSKKSNKVNESHIPCTAKSNVKSERDSDDYAFFSIISRNSKKACLIGPEKYLSNYPEKVETIASVVTKFQLKEIIKATVENVLKEDLILSHLMLEQDNSSFPDLADEINLLYDNLPRKTAFIVFMSGVNNTTEEKFRKNYCITTVKTHKSI